MTSSPSRSVSRNGQTEQPSSDRWPPGDVLVPLEAFLEQWNGEISWLWESVIAERSVTLLAGAPKAGKSTLVMDLIDALVNGRHLMRNRTKKPASIALISEESVALADRLRSSGLREQAEQHDCRLFLNVKWPDWSGIVSVATKAPEGSLVILDTASAFWNVEDENQAAQINRALRPILSAVKEGGLTILITHHLGKAASTDRKLDDPMLALKHVRGSTALVGAVDTIAMLMKDSKSETRRLLVHGRFGRPVALVYESPEWLSSASESSESRAVLPLSTTRTRGRKVRQAEELIREKLEDGPKEAAFMFDEGRAREISMSSMKRAKNNLGIQSYKVGLGWRWQRPEGGQGDQTV